MAENRKPPTDRSQKRQSGRRQLRFEPLESRSLLSAIAVTAPAAHRNPPSLGWLPQRNEIVTPAAIGQGVGWSEQVGSSRQPVSAGGLDSLISTPMAASPDGRLLAGRELGNAPPALPTQLYDLIAESMVTMERLSPYGTMSPLGVPGASYDLMHVADSPAGVDRPEEPSGQSDSMAAAVSTMPLSIEMILAGPTAYSVTYGGAPSGHSGIALAQFLPSRSAAPPAGGNAARGFASFPGGRSDTSGGEGGGARSSAALSSMPALSTSLGSGSNSAAPPASTSDFGSRASAGTAGSLSADSSNDAEGGYVDIGNMPGASGLLSPARQSPIEGLDDGSVGDPVSSGGPAGDAPRDGVGVVKDDPQPADAHADDVAPLDLAEQASAPSPSNAAEGGMVALAVAAPQDAQPVSTESPQPGGALPNMQEIELDNGLGLFHAFELATAPLQLGNRAAEGSEKTSETGRPSAADALPMPPAHSAVKPAKSEDNDLGEEVGLRPVALSSVVFAAMLVPVANAGRARGSSDRRRSSP